MRAGPLKTNRVAVNAVNQHPIRFAMKVAARLSFPFQRVLAKLAGKRFSGQHPFDNAAQFAPILIALFSQLHIAFELPSIAGRTHQMPKCLNRSDVLGACRT